MLNGRPFRPVRSIKWPTTLSTAPEDYNNMIRYLGNAQIYTIHLLGAPHYGQPERVFDQRHLNPEVSVLIQGHQDAVNASMALLEDHELVWYFRAFYR